MKIPPAEPDPRAQTTTPINLGPASTDSASAPAARVNTAGARPAFGVPRQTFQSLAVRDFRYLWLGMLVMMGAMQMQMLARGYLVYDLTDQNAALLGVINAANALPLLALSLFGGAIADRMERKRIVQLGQAAAGLLALLIAVLISLGNITWLHLLGAAVIHGCLISLLMPARRFA